MKAAVTAEVDIVVDESLFLDKALPSPTAKENNGDDWKKFAPTNENDKLLKSLPSTSIQSLSGANTTSKPAQKIYRACIKQLQPAQKIYRACIKQLLSRVYISSLTNILIKRTLFNAIGYDSSLDNEIDKTLEDFDGWDSDSGSEEESEEEIEPPTFTGVSKYIDNTDWNDPKIIRLNAGSDLYLGELHPTSNLPHGKGILKRSIEKRKKRKGKKRRHVDDIINPIDAPLNEDELEFSMESFEDENVSSSSSSSLFDSFGDIESFNMKASLAPRTKNTKATEYFKGIFENGTFVNGLWRSSTGDQYDGNFNKNGLFHKKGKYSWADGESYDGDWECGVRHGYGTYFHSDGSVYQGEFKNNKENGQGKKIWRGGGSKKDSWKDDAENEMKDIEMNFENKDAESKELENESDDNEKKVLTRLKSKKRKQCKYKTYFGQWKNGKMNGTGKLNFAASGSWFDGLFVDDMRNGRGTMHWSNGYMYVGEWQNDKMHGRGVIKNTVSAFGFNDGMIIYDGFFKDGLKHGDDCIEHFQDKSTYKGQYKNNKPWGYGCWLGPELRPYASIVRRESYQGEFKNGMKDGDGVLITFNGTYTGNFCKNYPHKLNYFNNAATNESYNGCWEFGRKNGTGVYEGRKGVRYSGEWEDDYYHGSGQLTNKLGHVFIGTFVHGKLEGHGEMTDSCHGSYIGSFKNSKYHGHGTLIGSDSPLDKYVGEWKDGERCGKGEQGFKDGSRYVGLWKNNVFHDNNANWWGCDGHFLNQYTGSFFNGLPHGPGLMRWHSITNTNSKPMIYEGNWVCGVAQGEGFLVYPNGSRFEGIFGFTEKKRREVFRYNLIKMKFKKKLDDDNSDDDYPTAAATGGTISENNMFRVEIQGGEKGCFVDNKSGRRIYGFYQSCIVREGSPTHEIKNNHPTLIPKRPNNGSCCSATSPKTVLTQTTMKKKYETVNWQSSIRK
jgi:hypothetical protein